MIGHRGRGFEDRQPRARWAGWARWAHPVWGTPRLRGGSRRIVSAAGFGDVGSVGRAGFEPAKLARRFYRPFPLATRAPTRSRAEYQDLFARSEGFTMPTL